MKFITKLLRKLYNKPKRLNPEIYQLAANGSREALMIYVSYCQQYQQKLDYTLFHTGLLASAQKVNADSLFDIGYFYANGIMGFEQNDEQSINYFSQAAKQGHTDAMNYLALSYDKGRDIKVDKQKIHEWYERSASLGNPDALTNLGNIYVQGKDADIDYEKAKHYFSIAAEKGNANAMNNLSYLYRHGLGVEKNKFLANEWLKKSHAVKSEKPSKLGFINS